MRGSPQRILVWHGRRRAWSVLAVAVVLAVWGLTSVAQPTGTEYEFKAAYLYKFANFVEWPDKSFSEPRAPITIGILGRDPFGELLDKLVKGETVNGRLFVVKRFDQPADLDSCHILFVPASEKKRWPAIREKIKDKAVLTVGDFDEFARSGGIINFVLFRNTVQFEINGEAAERAGLKISSKLLRLGRPISEK